MRRKTLSDVLARRLEPSEGSLVDMVMDAVLEQDMNWLRVDVDRAQDRERAAHENRQYAEQAHKHG